MGRWTDTYKYPTAVHWWHTLNREKEFCLIVRGLCVWFRVVLLAWTLTPDCCSACPPRRHSPPTLQRWHIIQVDQDVQMYGSGKMKDSFYKSLSTLFSWYEDIWLYYSFLGHSYVHFFTWIFMGSLSFSPFLFIFFDSPCLFFRNSRERSSNMEFYFVDA